MKTYIIYLVYVETHNIVWLHADVTDTIKWQINIIWNDSETLQQRSLREDEGLKKMINLRSGDDLRSFKFFLIFFFKWLNKTYQGSEENFGMLWTQYPVCNVYLSFQYQVSNNLNVKAKQNKHNWVGNIKSTMR